MAIPVDSATRRRLSAAGDARGPLANPGAVLASRRRSMSERLELALSWNSVAAELRRSLAAVARSERPQR